MKNTFKFLVNCLLSVCFCFSLFLFPILAEVPTSYTLSDTNLIGLLNYADLDFSTDIIYVGNNGRVQIVSPRFGSVSVANNEVKYTGKRIEYDGSKWIDVVANGTVTIGFSWGGVIFLNIPNQQKFCKVVSNASQVPQCLNQLNWSADFNNLLSDPYISQGVGYAREHLWDNWELSFRIIPPVQYIFEDTFTFAISESGIYYQYQLSNLDSNDTYLYEGLVKPSLYEGISGTQGLRFEVTYGTALASHVVLRSSWLPKSIDTNILIDQGNFSSQSVSSSINSTNNQLDSAVNAYDEIERELTDNFKVSVDAIDTNFSWGSNFLNASNFVRSSFNELVEPEPIYNMILFSLILGFALFIVGRLR